MIIIYLYKTYDSLSLEVGVSRFSRPRIQDDMAVASMEIHMDIGLSFDYESNFDFVLDFHDHFVDFIYACKES